MSAKQRSAQTLPFRLVFGSAACVGLLGALLLGWLTGLRAVMYAWLITLGALVPAPFLMVLVGVSVVAGACLTTGLVADAAARVDAAATNHRRDWLSRSYFAQIRRQRRHPFAWGLGAGLGLGVVGVWLVLAALVMPLETRSLSTLLLAQARLDTPRAGGDSPQARPRLAGPLHASAWSTRPVGSHDPPVLDAFGHPVQYEAGGAGIYTLRSHGLDGSPSSDDLCLHARGEPTPLRSSTSDPLAFVDALRANTLGWSEQARAIERSRCSALP